MKKEEMKKEEMKKVLETESLKKDMNELSQEIKKVSSEPTEMKQGAIPMVMLRITKMGRKKLITIPENILNMQLGDYCFVIKATDEFLKEVIRIPRKQKLSGLVTQYNEKHKRWKFYN